MQTLKVLCVALVLATTSGSNKLTDLSDNTMELLRQLSSEQLQELIDEEQVTMMLQNTTQDSCDCGPKGKGCKYVEGRRECICNSGYANYESVCQRCVCEIPNQICSFRWLSRYCECPEGYEQRYQKCERCVCGPNSKFCFFSSGDKHCSCEDGYKERLGGCDICDCGANSTDCRYNKNGGKECSCVDGYSDMKGKCKECSCGDHGKCTFNEEIKSCICDKGYASKNGKCEACECGENGECVFDIRGKKSCKCEKAFQEYNGLCLFCKCYYGRCVPMENGFQCICNEGYLNVDGKCVACKCGQDAECVFEEWGRDVQKKCFCPKGYMQDVDGRCSGVPICDHEAKCPNSTVCVNTDEGYKCVCKEGFRPLRKNADPKQFGCEDICGQNNCVTGECEVTGDHYHCKCQDGYAGTYCEVELDVYPKKKSMVVAFSVLATIIIVLLITTVFFCRKVR